jgi:hypothetical protein
VAVSDLASSFSIGVGKPAGVTGGYISGHTRKDDTPSPTPVSALVRLRIQSTGAFVASPATAVIASNPVDGSFVFHFVDPSVLHTIETIYGTGDYDVETRGFLTPVPY